MLPNLSGRLKYTFLKRDSNFLLSELGAGPNDILYLERFIGRYDGQSFDRNEVRGDIDWAPVPMLDIAIHEAAHVVAPDLDEATIDRLGRHTADLLWRMGFRKTGDE